MLDVLSCAKLGSYDLATRSQFIGDMFLETPYGSNLNFVNQSSNLQTAIQYLAEHNEFSFDCSLLDCVTFVEAVLGMLLTIELNGTAQDFFSYLQSIRYKHGLPTFLYRNHFMGADWLVNNRWCVQESAVMHQYYEYSKLAEATINRSQWLFQHPMLNPSLTSYDAVNDLNILLKDLGFACSTLHKLRYLPLTFVLDNWQAIQCQLAEFCIMCFVRPNWDLQAKIGTRLNISHVGCGVMAEGGYMFYHASLEQARVVKLPMQEYLESCKNIASIDGVVFVDSKVLNK